MERTGPPASTQDDLLPRAVAVVRLGTEYVDLVPGGSVTVGRGSTATLNCSDPRVSRSHVTVRCYGDGRVEVEDGGTTNGTFSYGRPVHREPVSSTTVYAVGDPDGPEVTVFMATGIDARGAPETFVGEEGIPLTIGRSADNSIVLDDPLVSRYHARVVRRGDAYEVVDLDSRNGVQVNGAPVGAGFVGSGDRLTVGRTTFHVLDGMLLPQAEKDAALVVQNLGFTLPNGATLLKDVSLSVPSASLLAIIGPSGAGKSTFLRALTGSSPATSGQVLYAGLNLYANYATFRERIGVVPQDDVVHRQLTIRQCLGFAAELRLPRDYTPQARAQEVARVLADLSLTEHQDTRIARLSGGQRKRASVSMELLNEPSLLILDEPTSGLDPNLDRSIMSLLRRQADSGRIVVVVTHSVANLHVCDNVLVLAPGGTVAYFGPPQALLRHFGVEDYADVFLRVTNDPEGCTTAFQAIRNRSGEQHAGMTAPLVPELQERPRSRRRIDQWGTLMRRQLRVVLADRSYAVATLVLPLVLALMAMVIPGAAGFGRPDPTTPGEASQLLVILIVGAAFMGMTASIRELVSERSLYLRERAVGLSPTIYLSAKFCTLSALTLVQATLLVVTVLVRKPAPPGAALLGNGSVELVAAVFLTALASAAVGLLLSALAGTNDQTMPALVVTVMAQLVVCGGLITVTGRPLMEAIAAFFPSRWGYAMAASTVDLRTLNPLGAQDQLWQQSAQTWTLCGLVLLLISAVSLVGTLVLIRQQKSTV